MPIFKDKNLKFSILFWLFFAIPLGISVYLVRQGCIYQKYLLSNGELSLGTYRRLSDSKDSYAIVLSDGKSILSVLTRLKNLEPEKEYQLIYTSAGDVIFSIERFPLDKYFIFRDVELYAVGLLILVAAACYAAHKLSAF